MQTRHRNPTQGKRACAEWLGKVAHAVKSASFGLGKYRIEEVAVSRSDTAVR